MALTMAGCGGGDGNETVQAGNSGAETVAPLNAADAVKRLSLSTASWSPLRRTDSSATRAESSTIYASLGVYNSEPYPFVAGGVTKATVGSKELIVSVMGPNSAGGLPVLIEKYRWKLHFDVSSQIIGIGYRTLTTPTERFTCFAPSTSSALPTSTNSKGIYLSGQTSSEYLETHVAGIFAHYCNTTSTSPSANVEWSVVAGPKKSYFCLTFPMTSWMPGARICLQPNDADGFLDNAWVTIGNKEYRTDL